MAIGAAHAGPVFACERGHDLVAAEPPDIGHLAVVDVDVVVSACHGSRSSAMTERARV